MLEVSQLCQPSPSPVLCSQQHAAAEGKQLCSLSWNLRHMCKHSGVLNHCRNCCKVCRPELPVKRSRSKLKVALLHSHRWGSQPPTPRGAGGRGAQHRRTTPWGSKERAQSHPQLLADPLCPAPAQGHSKELSRSCRGEIEAFQEEVCEQKRCRVALSQVRT